MDINYHNYFIDNHRFYNRPRTAPEQSRTIDYNSYNNPISITHERLPPYGSFYPRYLSPEGNLYDLNQYSQYPYRNISPNQYGNRSEEEMFNQEYSDYLNNHYRPSSSHSNHSYTSEYYQYSGYNQHEAQNCYSSYISSSNEFQSKSISPSPSPSSNLHIDIQSVKNDTNTDFTVMIKNIPHRLCESTLKNMLDLIIPGCYTIVNLNMDMKKKRNLGYCFIKVFDNRTLLTLYEHIHNKLVDGDNAQGKRYLVFRAREKTKTFYH